MPDFTYFFRKLKSLISLAGSIVLLGLFLIGLSACGSEPLVIELGTPSIAMPTETIPANTPVVAISSTPTVTVTVTLEETETPSPTTSVVMVETPVVTVTVELQETETPAILETPTATASPTVLTATSTPSIQTPAATATVAPALLSVVDEVVLQINRFRPQQQCQPVVANESLTRAAQEHSQDMAFNDYFSHVGSDGSSPWDRLERVGYFYSVAAENIAVAYLTPEDVVQGWLDSPGHRENVLNCDFQEVGVGYYYLENELGSVDTDIYWTLLLASP
jgi:uncharacterized protein YkwD